MQVSEDVKVKIAQLMRDIPHTLDATIGIEYEILSKDKVIASMPVDNRTKQPFGLLHGGASVVLAESLASIGAWLNIDENKFAVVGVEINANHIRAVKDGRVKGCAVPLHRGSKTQVWEIKISTPDEKLVCISRCTLAVILK